MGTDYVSPVTPVNPCDVWDEHLQNSKKVITNSDNLLGSKDESIPENLKEKKSLGKKKKWKKLSDAVNFSLPPRKVEDNDWTQDMVGDLIAFMEDLVENTGSYADNLCNSVRERSYFEQLSSIEYLMEDSPHVMECNFVRRSKKRKILKAYKQVKTKYCSKLCNGNLHKSLFMSSRVFKVFERKGLTKNYSAVKFERTRLTSKEKRRMQRTEILTELDENDEVVLKKDPSYVKSSNAYESRHAITSRRNADNDLDIELVNLLMELQNRDIRPEDYDVLLRLDDTIAPKTVDFSTVNSFETFKITRNNINSVNREKCSICMDGYEIDQNCKKLPCKHVFHDGCISEWLTKRGKNCPLDGIEL